MKRSLMNIALFLVAFGFCHSIWAQNAVGAARLSYSLNVAPGALLTDAYNAYAEADYQSAVFLLRKALSDVQNQSDDALYMLIMAGMHSGDYKAVVADTEFFLETYPQSKYAPFVKYQSGRALFYLGDYEKALVELGDFCHEYPDNMMYASALFWIGECFFAGYNFEQSRPFYERILAEFSDDSKAVDAKYRLDAIDSYERQEKLLYMLQQTGENYLASKEVYEKTLRRYELEDLLGLRGKITLESPYENTDYPTTIINVVEDSSPQAVQSAQPLTTPDYMQNTLPPETFYKGAPSKNSPEWENMLDALLRLKISAAEAQTLLDTEVSK